jgi:hypothetical protein
MKNLFKNLAPATILLLLLACAQKPPALKAPASPELFENVNTFYSFLVNRDLDSFADKNEIQSRFQDLKNYEAFLDSLLPAMWARKFERNRIRDFQILDMKFNPEQTEAWVKIWVKSDDILPFGKVMTFEHRWYAYKFLWYPAEIKAPKPTIIEKYR